jgi:hypothetical protein
VTLDLATCLKVSAVVSPTNQRVSRGRGGLASPLPAMGAPATIFSVLNSSLMNIGEL